MTYDNWKTTEPEDQGEREPEMEEEPEQEMTTDDDRATLEKVQQYVDERLVFHAHLLNDEAVARHIAALREALSVSDAAQVKAQARREALDAVAKAMAIRFGVYPGSVGATIQDALSALAAQPAARGEMENDGIHHGRGDDGDRERQGRAAHAEPRQSVGPDSVTPHPHEEDTMSHENPPPPDDAAVPSDAEMLCAKCRHRKGKHGCDTIRAYEEGWMTLCECECHQRASDYLHPLRQPPAPAPAPDVLSWSEEKDDAAFVADEIAKDGSGRWDNWHRERVARILRERFGPAVKALESILANYECGEEVDRIAADALAQLRARAANAKKD